MSNVECGLCGGDAKVCGCIGAFIKTMERLGAEMGIALSAGEYMWRFALRVWEEAADHTYVRTTTRAAAILGRAGGAKGGHARAASLSAERRSEISRNAARSRWAAPPKGEE
jgi:hypothetical protein